MATVEILYEENTIEMAQIYDGDIQPNDNCPEATIIAIPPVDNDDVHVDDNVGVSNDRGWCLCILLLISCMVLLAVFIYSTIFR